MWVPSLLEGSNLLDVHDEGAWRGLARRLGTIMDDATSPSRLRIVRVAAGTALAAQATVLLIMWAIPAAPGTTALAPVTFDENVVLHVNMRGGVVVLLALLAVSFVLLAMRPLRERFDRGVTHHLNDARWIIFSLTSSITVFLVAQLNGITAIGTLVLIYAATTTMTLFSVVQDRLTASSSAASSSPRASSEPPSSLALVFGAAIGIVPWGIIAFHEIAAGITGNGPSLSVRIITLVMLGFAFAFAITNWREHGRARGGSVTAQGERTFIVLSAVAASVFAWAVFLTTS